jgi:hypothetical protein
MILAVETHQLTRYFNDFCAVGNIDLAFERETFFGILGLDAGKSNTRHHNQRPKARRYGGRMACRFPQCFTDKGIGMEASPSR